MKYIAKFLLLGAALAVLGSAYLAAVEPDQPRLIGKVLILDTGRALEGDIERHGNQYRIRRSVGEVWVPADGAMRLCADWNEAFAFMAAQANLLDPDERVRLARWCQLHGLREQALSELNAAVKMQPNHREARQMQEILMRAVVMEKSGPAGKTINPPGFNPAPAPALDIDAESVALFTTRVQPILMNTCVSCHSGGQSGRFQLHRAYNGGQRAATLKNLGAVLPFVNPEIPNLSSLLIKAVSPHGSTGQAPLKKSIPYYTLESWVLHLLSNNPQLRADRPSSPPRPAEPLFSQATPLAGNFKKDKGNRISSEKEPADPGFAGLNTPPTSQPISKNQPISKAPVTQEVIRPAPEPMVVAAPATPASPPMVAGPPATQPMTSFAERNPSSPAAPTDPFDPAIFNQETSSKQ